MKNRHVFATFWTAILMANAMMLLGFWMIFLEGRTPIEFKNAPFPTDKEVYRRGETVTVTVDYCKKKNYPTIIYPAFVDGVIYYLPQITTAGFPVGCNKTSYEFRVPSTLMTGRYHLQGQNAYRVNVLSTRLVDWSTTYFDVVMGPDDIQRLKGVLK